MLSDRTAEALCPFTRHKYDSAGYYVTPRSCAYRASWGQNGLRITSKGYSKGVGNSGFGALPFVCSSISRSLWLGWCFFVVLPPISEPAAGRPRAQMLVVLVTVLLAPRS